MRRRRFIVGALGVAAVGTARAQQAGKVSRIAIVNPAGTAADISTTSGYAFWRAFFAQLSAAGYEKGRNLVIDRYSGEGQTDRYPALALEVVRSRPDLILTITGGLVLAFKAATQQIPIVAVASDPVVLGIVSNLARPEGNVTGVSADAGVEIWGKRLELLKEAFPAARRVAIIAGARQLNSDYARALRDAAAKLNVALVELPFTGAFSEAECRRLFDDLRRQKADALLVSEQAELIVIRRTIIQLAQEAQLPALYTYREYVEDGGLMAYAYDIGEMGRRTADTVVQLLKGAKVGDVPFYQVSKYDIVVNLKAASALGLTLPQIFLTRASEVIE